jgi:hypothetical protein
MALTEEQLQAYSRLYKAHFDKVGREGSYEPPDTSSDAEEACTRSGLLTPGPEHRHIARPRPRRCIAKEGAERRARERAQQRENERLKGLRLIRAEMAMAAPEVFVSPQCPGEYFMDDAGIKWDWECRTLRSANMKRPYLFAMDFGGDLVTNVAITSFGQDFWPQDIYGEFLGNKRDIPCRYPVHCV